MLTSLIRSDGRLNIRAIKSLPEKNKDLVTKIEEATSWLPDADLFTRVKYLKEGLSSPKRCKTCGKEIRVDLTYCSAKCSASDPEVSKAKIASRPSVEEMNAKREATLLAKHGVLFNSQRKEVKAILGVHTKRDDWKASARERTLKQFHWIDREKLNIEWISEQNKTRTLVDIAKEIGCHPTRVEQILAEGGVSVVLRPPAIGPSKVERDLAAAIKELGIEVIENTRQVIPPKEIDIYLPAFNLGIEVNGVYWHSEISGNQGKAYHLDKANLANSKGIDLLQFWDCVVLDKNDIVMGMIRSRTRMNKRVSARDCACQDLKPSIANQFISENHMQGAIQASRYIGLYFDEELVAACSIAKSRYVKGYDFEVLRFCSKQGMTVVGGASKLFSKIGGSFVSYANRRWSSGKLYEALGMRKIGQTDPSHWYTKDYTFLQSRIEYQKHKLTAMPSYAPDKTEWEIMQAEGYDRVWDCGNILYASH